MKKRKKKFKLSEGGKIWSFVMLGGGFLRVLKNPYLKVLKEDQKGLQIVLKMLITNFMSTLHFSLLTHLFVYLVTITDYF